MGIRPSQDLQLHGTRQTTRSETTLPVFKPAIQWKAIILKIKIRVKLEWKCLFSRHVRVPFCETIYSIKIKREWKDMLYVRFYQLHCNVIIHLLVKRAYQQ
jgi:hypothetical protein